MTRPDDDFDTRFRALIKAGFDDDVPAAAPTEPSRREETDDDENPSSVLAAWDRVDAIDEGPYRPEHLDLGGRWPFPVILASVAMATGLILGIAQLLDVLISPTLNTVAALLFFGGLATLLLQAFRRKGPGASEDDEDLRA